MCRFLFKQIQRLAWLIGIDGYLREQLDKKLKKKLIIDETCTGSQFIMNTWEQAIFEFMWESELIHPFNWIRKSGPTGEVLISPRTIIKTGDDTATIFLPPTGFFAVINHAMSSAYICTLLGLLPQFKWPGGYYQDSSKGPNVWEYFFKQPDTLPSLPDHVPFIDPITPRKRIANEPEEQTIMLPPADTRITCQIIKHFYTDLLRPGIIDQDLDIDVSACVGVHARSGAGTQLRSDNLHRKLKAQYKLVDNIPLDAYFEAIQKAFDHPDVTFDKIFLATDGEQTIETFMKRMPGQIIASPAVRHVQGDGYLYDNAPRGYQMGLEVIQDVDLLSRCAYLVHGNSNMTNFLQCLRPDQPHTDICEPIYSQALLYGKPDFTL